MLESVDLFFCVPAMKSSYTARDLQLYLCTGHFTNGCPRQVTINVKAVPTFPQTR